MQKLTANNVGLHRGNGLAVFKKIGGLQTEKVRKTFPKSFANKRLNIAAECKTKIVNSLDVTLNLNNATYTPTTKITMKQITFVWNQVTPFHNKTGTPIY